MKAKCKLDTLVTFGDPNSPTFGFITSIIRDAQGFRYLIEGKAEPIEESEIITVYREVKPRAKVEAVNE